MKPFQILLFLFSVFLLLFTVSLLFPEQGIEITKFYSLKFPSKNDIFEKDTILFSNISPIINPYINGENQLKPVPKTKVLDSVPIPIITKSSPSLVHLIQFPQNKSNSLSHFFEKIHTSKNLVRILHYGDSQIEADRITSYIRNRLQEKFGGGGCGLFPVLPLYGGVPSISQRNTSGWKKFTGFMKRDPAAGHNRYGALFSFSRYTGLDFSDQSHESWTSFKPSSIGYSTTKKFRKISIFASVSVDSVKLALEVNDSLTHIEYMPPDKKLRKLQWDLGGTPEGVKIKVSGNGTLDIFSLSADGLAGIAVDNIPLRGSSGLDFSKSDTVFLKEMYRSLNVGMLILQFGGNIVPEMSENYSYYEGFLKREFRLIKQLLPGIPVILIGPADMSIKVKGKYISYPSLTKVRDAMRKAALDSGFAFWDMYEAMGGENSMPGWVSANPPLAVSDFVHFNHRGAMVIAEKFYDALLHEYNAWLTLSQTE